MPKKSARIRSIVHSDATLRKASDYLEYDIHTFVAGLEIYIRARKTYEATEIGNAALDSFLLRARLLFDFFLRDNAPRDDVIALDYFHDQDPKPYKSHMTKAVKRERDKINKRLMHLTTAPMPRLRSNQVYSLKQIIPPIMKAFQAWLAVVPDSRLQRPVAGARKIFSQHLKRLEKLIP